MLKGPASPLNADFIVWGYKTTADASAQMVFNKYQVKYQAGTANTTESNTHDYEYVVGNQTIKYWDFGASEYNFWGATGGTFSSDGTVLTIPDLSQSLTEPSVKDKLFSSLYHRSPVSSDVVQLQFKRPYAKVRVLFYTDEPLAEMMFNTIGIDHITFRPSTGEISTAGTLEVTYSSKGNASENYSVTQTASVANFGFKDVTLDKDHGLSSNDAVIAEPIGGTEYYYVIPNNYNVPFILSAVIDDETKTATIPAAYMNWQPNYSYTYIFKITDAGKKIEIFDVKIDPWQYGGSQEEEWRNW